MKNASKTALLAALVLAFPLSACKPSESESDQEFASRVAPVQEGAVGMLLPDFAQLVAQEGGSVVNIQAVRNAANSGDGMQNDPFAELFRGLVPNQPDNGNEANFGSGVIISADGYILTNAHVVGGMGEIKVSLNDKRQYPAKLIGADKKSDIALLKIDAKDLPVAKIGNPDQLKSGEWVAAIGAPFGFDNSVTAGIVSAKGRNLPNETYTPFIQTDVAINPGNSGGPLFNLRGQVVGINSQIYSESGGYMGISFAIPIDVAMNVADQLKTTGKVRRAQLGILIQEVSYDLAKSFGLDKPSGALIAKVQPDGPGAKGGLQAGDIIRSVNGQEVRSSGSLPTMIGSLPPGKTVKLGIWRKGEEIEAEVTLGALSDDAGTDIPAANSSTPTFPELGLSLDDSGGKALVSGVQGPAASAGLRAGDIITEVNGEPVSDRSEFAEAWENAGTDVPILIQRNGNAVFLAIAKP